MTTIQKVTVWFIACIIIFLCFVLYTLITKVNMYESALDNTVDATIMEIDELKNIIKGERLKITNKCKTITKNLPHRFVQDWTCEL